MSTTTQASAPYPLRVQAGRAAGRIVRIDPPHAERRVSAEPLAWIAYVQPSAATLPPVVTAPLAPAAWSACAAPEVTAAEPRHVSRKVSPQPVLPAPERDRDVRTGVRRQRFYPEQWRRLQQPVIERLVNAHGQRLQWIGWERSLPQVYLPAGHLTRVILDLLQLTLRRTQPSGASDRSMCLRVGWQSGVTQTLVLVLEHPQLKLPPALMQYASAALAQSAYALQEPPESGELVRVRNLLRAIGGSITASRTRGGGTQFRIAVPLDDRTTLVRAWLEQAAHNAIPTETVGTEARASLAEVPKHESIIYQSQVSMFVVGRKQAETLPALGRADACLQSLSGSDDFVYRAARSRWLWLTMHDQLPGLEPEDGWQSQLVSRWDCLVHAALLTEQQTAAFHGLARAIVAKMDFVLGRRVPPLDTLTAPPPRMRHLRVDRAVAAMPPRPSQQPTRVPSSARVSLGTGSGATPSMRRRRWRYPI